MDDDLETPTTERPYSLHETMPTSANAPVVAASTPASVHLDAQPIGRSGSISSTTGRPRSDSNKKSQKSPSMKSVSLLPTKDKKKKKKRTLSTSSGVSGSIVALAKSVTHIGSPSGDDQSTSSRRKSGSKFLSKPSDGLDGDEDEDDDDDTIDDDDDDSDSEYEEHLPVTGFAVASNKRNGDFHAMFSAVDENDYLIEGELGPSELYSSSSSGQITAVPWLGKYWFKAAYTYLRITYVSTPTSLVGSPMFVGPSFMLPSVVADFDSGCHPVQRDKVNREENDRVGHSQRYRHIYPKGKGSPPTSPPGARLTLAVHLCLLDLTRYDLRRYDECLAVM